MSDHIDIVGGNSAQALTQFLERAERLIEERKAIQDDLKDVFSEAKANGFCTKTMRQIIRDRAMETHARQERDALLETYRAAIGLI